jgi:hypothetical protein
MKRVITLAACAWVAAEALAAGQAKDAGRVIADARDAMGGDRLAAVKTLTATGRTLRTDPGGNTRESEFEMALALPDKYLMRSVMVAMGNMSIYRHSGFNGGQVIEEIDRPPNLSGGNVVIRVAGPGGAAMDPEKMTAEQKAEADRMRLAGNKREFARLALGLLAASPEAFPLEFAYAGEAESADGRADVIDVKGEGGFVARLFVDRETRLPLMLSWMDREPLVMQVGPGGAAIPGGGGSMRVVTAPAGQGMTKEEREKLEKDLEERRKEAEATRRTVEFRLYYSDYRDVSGVKLPHRIQRSIDGKPTEEMIVDAFKVNPKIDARRFEVAR